MPDKELRRMNRTELIEIIYALQQNEQKLQEENDRLSAELEDRKIRLDQSGSIAEASLSLNHIFEDAQAAADQYLESLRSRKDVQPESGFGETEEKAADIHAEADQILEDAGLQKETILKDAQKQADEILEEARQKAEEYMAAAHKNAEADIARQLEQTDAQCEKKRQAIQDYHDRFMQDMSDVLKDNPELLERVRRMGTVEGE